MKQIHVHIQLCLLLDCLPRDRGLTCSPLKYLLWPLEDHVKEAEEVSSDLRTSSQMFGQGVWILTFSGLPGGSKVGKEPHPCQSSTLAFSTLHSSILWHILSDSTAPRSIQPPAMESTRALGHSQYGITHTIYRKLFSKSSRLLADFLLITSIFRSWNWYWKISQDWTMGVKNKIWMFKFSNHISLSFEDPILHSWCKGVYLLWEKANWQEMPVLQGRLKAPRALESET